MYFGYITEMYSEIILKVKYVDYLTVNNKNEYDSICLFVFNAKN
jgi:hypothetical protein